MTSIAICDDDEILNKKLEKIISEEFAGYNIPVNIISFENGEAFLDSFNSRSYDLIFMDIHIRDTNGFDLMQQIPQDFTSYETIFITSDSMMVFDSLVFKPFDFVRKMEYQHRIPSTIKRYVKTLKQNETLTAYYDGIPYDIKYSSIIYIKSNNHHIDFVTEKLTYSCRGSIKNIEAQLLERDFIRIHRKYIVNINYLKKINDKLDEVTLKNGTRLEMSRYLKDNVKRAIGLHYSRRG